MNITKMGENAKIASLKLATLGKEKDIALRLIAQSLLDNQNEIIKANNIDLQKAKLDGLSDSLLDRLALNVDRIKDMSNCILNVAKSLNPIGNVISGYTLDNGLSIRKVSVPLGVVGIIYEARPNVTSDAVALCLKSGNSVILRGGKEAINSNIAIVKIIREALFSSDIPQDAVQIISDTSHESARELMELTKYIDVLIPRGGKKLINSVVLNSKVPVIETGAGNCHIYVDKYADVDMAAKIIYNAKTSRPSVCNAIETVLVHKDIADTALPKIKELLDKKNVQLRGCDKTIAILGNDVIKATEEDYKTEFLDYILAIKVIENIDAAIEHINYYSSSHSEAIITKDFERARKFQTQVDSAAVYVNASTRFTDGAEFGLGAEIGISTQKLHARGPMGLSQLTSSKYIIDGCGQIR